MPDCFISYSREDQPLADFVHKILTTQGLQVFMASASLQPGQRWADQILAQLSASSWVVFLASTAACRSPWVQQELGIALHAQKKLVPVVWDMNPSHLPGWVGQRQALVLDGETPDVLRRQIESIAVRIHEDKRKGALIAGAIFMGLLLLALND